MSLYRRHSCARPPALGIALLAGAVVLAVPHLLPAASTGSTGLYMPQGSTAGTANGDYVSDTGGMNSVYRYFVEVPSGSSLQIEIFDADIGAGGATEDTAGRDRDRGGSYNTSVAYSLFDPSGTAQTTQFTTGNNTIPTGADNAWLTFYKMTGNTVRDNFGTAAYTNNDGNNNWSAAWIETDSTGAGAGSGAIQITGGELRLQDGISGTPSLEREADLSGTGLDLAVAFFTFDFRTSNNLENQDQILVQVSGNGGGSWTTLETFSNDSSGSRSFNITAQIANNTRVRFILSGAANSYGDADEFFFVDNVQITDGVVTAGHWELRVDMGTDDDINAIGIRAHDGTSGSGGTELNVYYDSQNQLGVNPPASGTTSRSYELYPYISSGCTAGTNDFDYDSNRGDTGSMAFHSRTGTYNQSLTSTDLSTDNVWDRTTINSWTSDSTALEYGIWNQDATITSYVVGGTPNGNYTTAYLNNFQFTANPPAANPTTNAFRVYLPTDAGAAPVKPYVEQQVTHDSGPNPPDTGQSSDVTVTVRVVNPTAHAITFSASNLVTANIPGSGAVYADASQISQGTLVSEPAMLGTGNITWNPGTVAAGATALMSYEVRVTPTSNGQRIPVTASVGSGNGTQATFVDETGNTTQTRATYTFGPLCELAVTEALATHAVVSSFQAYADESGGVRVEWTTASEVGTAGFRLLRWDGAANQYLPVHENLLPGLLRSPQGGGYRFLDETAAPNQAQRYLLEEVEVNGKRRSYGPYSVTPDWRRQDGPRLAIANQRANELGFAREEHPVVGRPRADKEETASQGELRSARAFAKAGSAGAHISIRETGLYYVTREEVATWLGLSVDKADKAIAKGSLSLTRAGQPVAWFPDGTTSGAGKKEDKPKSALGLYFYGEALDSLYSLDTVYRLREGSGPVMQTGTVAPAAAAVAEISFPDTKPFEEDAFPATAIKPDPESDYWFWNFIISGDPDLGKQTFAFDAPALASTGTGSLTLGLHGATDNSTPGEHHATVALNGTTIGETEWQGIAPQSATFPVPDGLLLATGNQLEITGTVGGGAPFSFYFIDGFQVGYPRRFTSAGDGLTFQAGGNPQVTVTGFSNSTVRLLDVSIPSQPRWLTGASVEADPGAPGTFRSSFVPSSAARYLAAGPGAVKTPFAVRPWSATDPRVQGIDVLIVVPPGMKDEAERLADHRRDQGLESLVVDLNEVADAFGDGTATPHALRKFLRNAWSNRSATPRYVVLVGEGTLDYRNLLGFGDSVMPPLMIQAEGGLFPSDNRLVDATGDGKPEMAVGRIPVVNSAELGAYIDKIIAYESASNPAWAANALMLADSLDGGASFSADSDRIASRLPGDFAIDRIYLDTEPLAQARTHLLQAIDSGASLINFIGHGGLDRLSGAGLLTSEDVASLNNGERLPVLTAMTCTVNRFAVPGVPSLGELLVKSGTGGAAAVWGPSGLSFHGEARQLAEVFYRLISEPDSGRLGDQVLRSMQEFIGLGGDNSLLNIYNLLGDPALLVRRSPAPPTSGGSTNE